MAASTQQKVDYLLKKIGYTASKTGLAEDSSLSGTKKAPFAEAVPSPLVIASTCLWADSTYIPATPPGSDSDYVKVYLSGASGHRMTVDSTVSGNRAYIAYSTYNDNSTAILGDWIDTQFGASYIIKVYKGDPNSGGVALSAAGSGSSDGWFFDYSSGILNFNDTNVPSGVTDSNIYVVGYRYIGTKGPTAAGGISTFTTQYVSGVSTFADDVNLYGTTGVTSAYWDKTGDAVILKDHTKASFGTGQDLEFFHDGANSTIKNTTGTLFVDNGGTTFRNVSGTETQLTISDNGSVAAYFDNAKKIETLSVGATVTGNLGATSVSISGISTFEGNVDANGTLDVDGQSELDDVNVSGVSTFGQLVSASAGANIAGTAGLNVVGVSTLGQLVTASAGLNVSGAAGLNVAGVTTVAGQIDGNAGADISGGETTLSSATVSDLTSGRVVYAGSNGALQDNANLTFDGTNLTANVNGTLQTAAQPNITSLGTLSSLNVTGGVSIGGTLTYEDVTNVDSVGVITARDGIKVTSGDIEVGSGLKHSHSASTTTYTVKVITKTAAHRYNGTGSSLGYTVDGIESPFLTLTPGRTYKFDQADSSNNTHQIRFYRDAAKSTNSLYEQGVTYNGTAGQAGAYTQIVVSDTTPKVLHYQCVNHGHMGNALSANTGDAVPLETTDGGVNITGVCTATDFSGAAAGAADFPNGINVANTKTIAFPGNGNTGATIKHQSGNFEINNDTGNVYFDTAQSHFLRTGGSTLALTLDGSQNATFAGTVSDPKGDLRDIPVNAGSSAMTLSASDAGKVVATTTGGWVIPTGLSQGNTFTLLNDSGSTQTIDATALTTLYDTTDGANVKASTLTLGARSMATIWMGSGTVGYIQASALTVS